MKLNCPKLGQSRSCIKLVPRLTAAREVRDAVPLAGKRCRQFCGYSNVLCIVWTIRVRLGVHWISDLWNLDQRSNWLNYERRCHELGAITGVHGRADSIPMQPEGFKVAFLQYIFLQNSLHVMQKPVLFVGLLIFVLSKILTYIINPPRKLN